MFELAGHSVERMTREDVAETQLFLERCSEFFERFEGGPPPKDVAERELTERPAGYPAEDHFVFLVRDGGAIVALLNVLRNFPRERQWWIGFQIVDPALRGRGLGARLFAAAEEWMVGQGAERIQLAVAEGNSGSERFWGRMGFVETEWQRSINVNGMERTVVLMRKTVEQTR